MSTTNLGVVTWNVAEMEIQASDAALISKQMDVSRLDLIFVTVQELFALNAVSIVGGEGDGPVDRSCEQKMHAWDAAWQSTLGEDWYRVSVASLGAVRSSLYARQKLQDKIKRVRCDGTACGMAGMLVNKGAAAIKAQLNRTTFVFVGAHLAAHAKSVARRNADFRRIDTLLFRSPSLVSPPDADTFDIIHKETSSVAPLLVGALDGVTAWFGDTGGDKSPSRRLVNAFDRVIFAGDLNYRLVVSDRDVFDNIYCAANPDALFKLDELTQQIEEQAAFDGYIEAPLSFPPTYKYDKGTDTFDSSKKRRVPSWTDRILFTPDGIAPYAYSSVVNLRCSDHKPVFAKFSVLVE